LKNGIDVNLEAQNFLHVLVDSTLGKIMPSIHYSRCSHCCTHFYYAFVLLDKQAYIFPLVILISNDWEICVLETVNFCNTNKFSFIHITVLYLEA